MSLTPDQLTALGQAIGTSISHALTTKQEQMDKAMKSVLNARQARPDVVLPAQYPRLDPNKIAVHTDPNACTTFLYSMAQLSSRMKLERAFRANLYRETEQSKGPREHDDATIEDSRKRATAKRIEPLLQACAHQQSV